MFEVFREAHVPVCEDSDILPDPFNDFSALDGEQQESEDLF